jgi:phage terminase large subunit GpA-like protein
MIEECPELRERVKDPRSRDSGNTMLAKEFPGGILIMTGANSAVGLRSMPVRYLFLDEIDGYTHDVDGEGDPVELAVKRTSTFARNRKIFVCSTPTIRGVSRIETAYERSDKRMYKVPCPECGFEQQILWRNIRWPEGKPHEAALVCESCEAQIPSHRKGWMLERGKWVPTAEGDGRIAGYHLSSLYSPLGWYPWSQAAEDFLAAKEHGKEALKTWTNTVLAETWEEEGDSVEDTALLTRREEYAAEVPESVLVLTAGVDVQDDRLEVEIVGWGKGEESWAIDYQVLWGDPGSEELWQRLDETLSSRYQHERGGHFNIAATCVDSGGHYTQQVYGYCRKHRHQRIYAIKGMAGSGRPIVAAPSRRGSGHRRRTVDLFTVGVDAAKGLLYSRLGLTVPGAGYCHFPTSSAFDEEYFAQLTAEKIITRYHKGFPRREWVKTRPRNEALDCRVYAMAAMYILSPAWDAIEQRLTREPKEKPAQNTWSRRPVRRRGNRALDWKERF